MKKVEMPKMGDTMEEGKILNWLKQEGDLVKRGEPLAEVETDKVNIEIESFASGVLRKILVPAGGSAAIGAAIALVGAANEPLPADLQSAASQLPTTPTTIGPSNTNGHTGSDMPAAVRAETQAAASFPSASREGRIFISPVARRLAQEHRLDYNQLAGTGPNGRIIKLDVEAVLAQQTTASVETMLTQQAITPAVLPATREQPAISQPLLAAIDTGDVIEVPLSAMRRTIARRLSQSMQSAPHYYVTSVIDATKLAPLRQQINAYAATDLSPVKVSFNDLIIKAVARALLRMPQVNVSFAEDKLLQKRQVHIGVAIALEAGLIVPVLHNADKLGMLEIARETQRLAAAARDNKLRPEDLSGGTFTISNLGMFDVESFTAVINPPEAAILAVGAITPTPVVVDGQVVVRDRVKMTLSSDHRAIDGATAARFLQEIRRLLEEPFGLIL